MPNLPRGLGYALGTQSGPWRTQHLDYKILNGCSARSFEGCNANIGLILDPTGYPVRSLTRAIHLNPPSVSVPAGCFV